MRRNAWILLEMLMKLANAEKEEDLPDKYKYTESRKSFLRLFERDFLLGEKDECFKKFG